MDNQKKPEMPADDSWFDELLAQPQVGSEIQADEQAVNAAGLTDLADMELEQIILEAQNMEIPELDDPAFSMDVIAEETLEVINAQIIEEPQEAPAEETEMFPAEIIEGGTVEALPVEIIDDVPEEPIPAEVIDDVPEEPIPAEVIEEILEEPIPAEVIDDVPEGPIPAEVIEEILEEPIPVETTDSIPNEMTDATLVILPSEPVSETMDATMVHTIEPSEALLWELATADETSEEEEVRQLPETPFLDDDYKNTFGESGEALEMVFADMSEANEKPAKKERATKSTREKPVREKPAPKGRPRMKKGYGLLGIPHIISTLVWLAIILAIGVSLGRMAWVITTDVLAFGRDSKECEITISENDNMDIIANKLKNAGLIRYPELFKLYADLTDAEEEITAGTYTLNTKYDYMALVNYMSSHATSREEVEVLIPEGYTCAQIFALLEEKKVCSAEDLKAYASDGELGEYWFLEGVERGTAYCLEGYLFPDTYKFYTNDKPGRVLTKFLDNFEYRFTDIMKEKLDVLNDRMGKVMTKLGYPADYVEAHKFTMRDIVIIASMIEKEKANNAESYDVSSVIYNRLTNAKEYPYLNIDATLIYALDGNIDPETGKTKPLTSADLKMDHPYNTYTQKGMVPGPISNPGRNSLDAALDPNETKYYFYVYNPKTGVHLFAKNATEHQKNVDYVRTLG